MIQTDPVLGHLPVGWGKYFNTAFLHYDSNLGHHGILWEKNWMQVECLKLWLTKNCLAEMEVTVFEQTALNTAWYSSVSSLLTAHKSLLNLKSHLTKYSLRSCLGNEKNAIFYSKHLCKLQKVQEQHCSRIITMLLRLSYWFAVFNLVLQSFLT